jgi:hypothetical protein
MDVRVFSNAFEPNYDLFSGHANLSDPERAFVARHPKDLRLHIAAAVRRSPTDGGFPNRGGVPPVVRRLMALRDRFGDQPSLDATILRYCASSLGGTQREVEEELLLVSSMKEAREVVAQHRPGVGIAPGASWEASPGLVAVFNEATAHGEVNDPDNAFFPLMRSVYLFGIHQDEEALRYIEKASVRPAWRDYCQDHALGEQKLLAVAHGEPGIMTRAGVAMSQIFPHYGCLRSAARTATALAVLREQRGDVEGGFRIRRARGRIGAIIRVESTFTIGSLVGAAITQTAALRPGGAQPYPRRPVGRGDLGMPLSGYMPPGFADDDDPYRTRDANREAVLEASRQTEYLAYLIRTGHPHEAT